MESKCPKCGKKIEHEDFLFEVQCDCGSRFNPFMLEENKPSEPEAPAEGGGPTTMSAMGGVENFTEAQNAFQEIQQFGESLGAETPTGADQGMGAGESGDANKAAPAKKAAPRKAAAPVAPIAEGEECPMTGGDSLPGYTIEAYFMPVSAMADVDSGGDPMRAAMEALWSNARNGGGNGLVSLRWMLSPDGSKVMVSGTPVRIARG